jgi:NarL family two-component system response regulator YdfI
LIDLVVVAPSLALRVGLRQLFSETSNLSVVGECADLDELTFQAQEADVLVLTSIALSDLRDLTSSPGPAVLLLTDKAEDAQTLAKFSKRVWGALPLNASEEELAAAVVALGQGLWVGAPVLVKGVMRTASGLELSEAEPLAEALTTRELEILQLIAQGLANKQIALALGISEHTVKFHLSSAYAKLEATGRTEAIRIGIQQGLITL